MKRIILLPIFLVLAINISGAQNKLNGPFTVNVSITNIHSAKRAVLYYANNSKLQKDSVLIENGKFSFSGIIGEPTVATLVLRSENNYKMESAQFKSNNTFDFYLAPGLSEIKADSSLKKSTIQSSSKYVSDYNQYKSLIKEFFKNFNSIKRVDTLDQAEFLNIRYQALRESVYKIYILNNPSSPVAILAFGDYCRSIVSDSLKSLYYSITDSIRALPSGLKYERLFKALDRVKIGLQAPEFEINDINGMPIKLSSFKGEYLLIDFWASWCYPCRKGHPELIEIYNRFKNKDFTIISISLDKKDTEAVWRKAIMQDGIGSGLISVILKVGNPVYHFYTELTESLKIFLSIKMAMFWLLIYMVMSSLKN